MRLAGILKPNGASNLLSRFMGEVKVIRRFKAEPPPPWEKKFDDGGKCGGGTGGGSNAAVLVTVVLRLIVEILSGRRRRLRCRLPERENSPLFVAVVVEIFNDRHDCRNLT